MKKVITYGTFDLLHTGHINILRRAKDLGDYLVVAISSDGFNDIKGKKAYYSFEQRKAILEAIRYVDEVIPEDNWEQKHTDVSDHNIDVFVMGDDWEGEFDFLKDQCEVIYLPRTAGISTTQIKKDLNSKNHAREFAVGIYLSFFRIVFSFCKLFQTKNKTTFVTSFGGNTKNVVKAHEKLLGNDQRIVVLQTPDSSEDFAHTADTVLEFQIKKIVALVKSIYHLATSSHVFVDNYFGFLAAATFKKDVTCIQLWHAAGAIKKFGLKDQTNQFRSPKALQRFKEV